MRLMMLTGLSVLMMVIVIGCAGTSTGNWQTFETPTDPNILYATGMGESANMQLALDKAAMNARTEIGRQLELKLNDMQKNFAQEIEDASPDLRGMYTVATKQVVSTVLRGSKINQQKYREKDGRYEAVAQVIYDIEAAKAPLLDEIKKNENLYTEFMASKAFQELEAEIEKYEQEKKAQ